ncbi:hypothetical protein CDAR_591401 [Caerostris darwini]|uniref:Uncharacterized protein n=1 Tax=Caerostris darwini TaxID=1538125 RepID=A0AAV4QU83_9ARAC|nr:hypothetical protein CDAR_591401 [Caerostris darwini]
MFDTPYEGTLCLQQSGYVFNIMSSTIPLCLQQSRYVFNNPVMPQQSRYASNNLVMSSILCLQQSGYAFNNSVMSSTIMSSTIRLCLQQSGYVFNNPVMSSTIRLCLQQFGYVFNNQVMPSTIRLCLQYYVFNNPVMSLSIAVILNLQRTSEMSLGGTFVGSMNKTGFRRRFDTTTSFSPKILDEINSFENHKSYETALEERLRNSTAARGMIPFL